MKLGAGAIDKLPEGIKKDPEAVAETITNNMRKVIMWSRAWYSPTISATWSGDRRRCSGRWVTDGMGLATGSRRRNVLPSCLRSRANFELWSNQSRERQS